MTNTDSILTTMLFSTKLIRSHTVPWIYDLQHSWARKLLGNWGGSTWHRELRMSTLASARYERSDADGDVGSQPYRYGAGLWQKYCQITSYWFFRNVRWTNHRVGTIFKGWGCWWNYSSNQFLRIKWKKEKCTILVERQYKSVFRKVVQCKSSMLAHTDI